MPLMLDDFHKLKEKVAELQSAKDRAEGAKAQILARLKADFGCTSLKEAEELLEREKEKEVKLAMKFTRMKKEWEEKWKDKLDS